MISSKSPKNFFRFFELWRRMRELNSRSAVNSRELNHLANPPNSPCGLRHITRCRSRTTYRTLVSRRTLRYAKRTFPSSSDLHRQARTPYQLDSPQCTHFLGWNLLFTGIEPARDYTLLATNHPSRLYGSQGLNFPV